MMIEHIHSTKEKLYGLFRLPVQPDFIIGLINSIAEYYKLRYDMDTTNSIGQISKIKNLGGHYGKRKTVKYQNQ